MKIAIRTPHHGVARMRSLPGLGVALLCVALLGGASQDAAAQSPAAEGVTYGQPKIFPGEFNGDLRKLTTTLPVTTDETAIYRPLLRAPLSMKQPPAELPPIAPKAIGGPLAPMPGPIQSFAGLSKTDSCTGGTCGGGWPPDMNGDVGPNHYVLAVNSAVAIYSKTGTRLAAFTENNLWSGVGSTACNGHSQGDPVVVYDWLADRFVITWFAFVTTAGPNYQCIAASKTSDPVTGGWWLYAVRMDPGGPGLPPVGYLNDYAKFGHWHDCLYMSANEFSGNSFKGVLFASFSRSDLYSGAPLTYSLGFLAYPANQIFGMVPEQQPGQGGECCPAGYAELLCLRIADDIRIPCQKIYSGRELRSRRHARCRNEREPDVVPLYQHGRGSPAAEYHEQARQHRRPDHAKVQYRKIGGVESLWVTHNVDTPSGPTGMQWAQINVTGGTIVTTPVQQQIHAPDTALWRWMGSLAVDGQGNMALGYSTSGATSPSSRASLTPEDWRAIP
jgi:hypothetical protein